MKRVVVDASALAAVLFQEPDGAQMREQIEGATVFAPYLLQFELANIAWKKAKRHPANALEILTALAAGLDTESGLVWRDVPMVDVALLAQATGLTAYDASYVWLAGSLGADLITFDKQILAACAALAA